MIRLLGRPASINVRKVLWTCAELGIEPELVPVPAERDDAVAGTVADAVAVAVVGADRTAESEAQAVAAAVAAEFPNPNRLVPVLRDGAFVLWESNAICRYLATSCARDGDADRGALLPGAAQPRALVEQWMDWQATELNTAWRDAFMARVRHSPRHADAAAVAASVAAWNHHMALLDAHLRAAGPYATGEAFTLADVVLGLSVNRWRMTPMARPALPAIDAYFQRLAERPAFRRHGCNGLP